MEREESPGQAWLLLAPVFFVLIPAVLVAMDYANLPERYPVHWNIAGQPDSFAVKSLLSVFFPTVVGLVVVGSLGAMMWLAEFARSPLIRITRLPFLPQVLVLWGVGLLLGWVALLPWLRQKGYPTGGVWMLLIPAGIVLMVFAMLRPRPSATAATPRDKWKWGVFYNNPEDPALVVDKRFGLGWTFNFGHPKSWIVIAVITAIVLVPLLLLRRL
jgi:hypothetical protein